MMRLTKRALSAFLAFVMVFTMLPLDVWAEGSQTSGNMVSVADSYEKASDNQTLELDSASTVIAVGGTHTFNASLKSEDGTSTPLGGSACQWTSSKNEVATVEDGVVTGVGVGTAQITCTYGELETFAMVTVTEANYRLVYESNYPEDAVKYTYQNGGSASIGSATDTTVNETYEIGATATVASGIFTTINYDLVNYLGSDGNTYNVDDTITMNSNLTLTAQWEGNGNTTSQEQITVRYYKISNRYQYVERTVTATFTPSGRDEATVTFITGNNQDTIEENYQDFYGWTIGGKEYSFNEQVTTTASWRSTGWGRGYWLVEAHPLRAGEEDNVVHAQFFIRKADADGYGVANQYYSVGSGTVDATDFERDPWSGNIVSGTVAGSDNVNDNVNGYILTAPSAAQIANLMNITLDEASAVRWYVIKNQGDGFHVDGVIYLKDKYWRVEFVDPDTGKVVQTLLVEDADKIPVDQVISEDRLNNDLRDFTHWVDEEGEAVNLNDLVVTGDIRLTADFTRYSGYTVEYYLQNADNDRYTLDENATEVHRAETGTKVTADQKVYTGYTYNSNRSNASGTVNSEGTLVLKLYYDRKQYEVKYEYEGSTIPDGAKDQLPDAAKYKQGATVTVADEPEVTGYKFSGWTVKSPSGVTITGDEFTMPNQNVTLVGSWERTIFDGDRITVKVVKDGTEVNAAQYITLENLGGTQGFDASFGGNYGYVDFTYDNLNCADIKLDVIADITGYSVTVTSNPSGSTTGVVDDSKTVTCEITGSGASWSLDNVPGGATVTVTLKKLEYTVTYTANPAEGGSVTRESETVVHGGNGIGSTAQAKDGYYFTNWTDESGKVVSEDAKFVPQNVTGNATYTANFAQQTAITVKATDLTKPYDGDALAANDTYELTGELAKGHKLVVTTKVSGEVINVTDEGGKHQIASVKVLDSNGDDVTHLYGITYAEGDLTITPITITLTSGDYSWPYDGQSHSYPEVKVEGSFAKDEGFATGDDGKPLFTNFATVQSEGESKDNTFNYTLKEGTSEDNYNIVVEPGTISISNSYDVTYVFQGETPEGAIAPEGENYLAPERKHTVESYPQVPEGYTFDGWYVGETMYEPGEEITIVDQDITLVGKWTKLYKVTYDGNAPEGTTVDISGEAYQAAYYDDGQTVTLAPAPAAPDGYTFAGWEIVDSAAAITENSFTMPAQDVIVRATWTKRSDLSYTVNHYLVGTTLKVKDSETVPNQVFLDVVQVSAGAVPQGYELQGNDTQTITIQVTGNEVTFYYYKLATVKADDQEMTYGGTVPPLTAAVTGLYGSDEATKITYNTPTTTATSTSPVDNYPIEVTGNAIQGYYKVTYVPGELIIKPATMNLTVKGYDDFYDGAAHGGTVSGYPEGATLQYSTDNGSTWKEEEPTVTDYTENPVAVQVKVTLANYDEVIRKYTLNVKKRPVTLVSEGATREYNGEALTNANWHYEGEYEFVNGEVTEISTIGTQTEIGSSKNTIAYKKTAEFDEGNYIITLKEGYLVVTPPQNPNEYDVVTKTHDKNNLNPGEIVTFTITVKNIFADTATVTLNELPGVNFSENGTNKLTFQLNGGETKEVKATYTITEADVLAGKFVNTVSATLVVGGQTVEASATDTVTLKAAPALTVDKTVTSRPTNGSTYALDETITWSITVTNSGNVTLKDIKVSDSLTYQGDESGNKLSGTLTPPAGFDGNLDRGESVTYTYSYQVTEADLGKTLSNVATATSGETEDENEPVVVRTEDLKPSLSVTKTADRETAAVGETINYTITVTNNGNQTLNSIKVTDPLTGLNQEISTLKPGEASEAFKTSYTVKVSDLIAGSVVNTATAEAGNVTAEARKTVAITGSLNISVTLNSGEFTYDGQEHTVSGIKSVTYGNDVISVNNGTFKIGDTTFTLSCAENTATATGTNVVRNPDGTVGSYPVTAQPTDITVKMGGQNVTGKVTVTNVIAGSLQINPRKVTITVQDAEKTYGESDPTPFQAVLSGDPLVNDTDLGTITCSRTNKDEDAGVYEDVLTAACETNENYDVIVVNGDFTIKKYTLPVVVTIEGTSAEKPYTGSEQSVEGYMITGITVNGVESELYPEASVQFVGEPYDKVASGTYVGEYSMALNKDDFENGNANFTNVTFQVTPGKLTITPGTYQPVTKTHEKKQDGSDLFALNETVTFPITVVNIYNTPAKVTLKEQEGVFFEGGSQTAEQVLGPGDKMIFNAYYVITEQDILNESFTNTVEWTIARIDDSEKITGTAADTVEVVAKAPKLTVSKAVKNSGDAPFDLDETITYTITVKNDGNVTVTGINVADLVTTEGENRQAATVNTEAFALKPGEDKSFEYTYKVQQSDLGKTILNTATATGSDPTGEEVVGTDDVEAETEERNPKLDVTKVASEPANGTEFVLDETITYTITVKNTGNVTLENIFVSDKFSRDGGTTWEEIKDKLTPSASTPITLEPGEQKIYTYQYTVVEEDLGKTLQNTATAIAPNPDDPTENVTDDTITSGEKVEDPNPDLSVDKKVTSDPGSDGVYDLGDTITYTITVTNEGNVTLTGVKVTDELKAGGVKIEDLPVTGGDNITLKPNGHEGDTVILYVDYTVTEEDLGKTLVNTVTAASDQTKPDPEDPNNDDHDETDGEKTEDPTPNMEVSKTVVGDKGSYRVGDVITYQITVKNTGNTTIHNIKLTDVMQASGDVKFTSLDGGKLENGVPVRDSLAPKTAWVVTCQYTVQLADADSDGTKIYNKVTVDAADGPDGNDPEAQTPGEDIDPIYTVVIKYQNGAGRDLHDPAVVKVHDGQKYSVDSPNVPGYHLTKANEKTVSGTLDATNPYISEEGVLTLVVVYARNPVEDDDDDPVVNPDNDPDETTEETEDEVDPGVYIEDPDDYTLTPITEEETPLADLDVGDHTCCIMHFLLMLAAMVVLGFYTDSKKKHQARIFELKRTLAMEKGKNPDQDNSQQS